MDIFFLLIFFLDVFSLNIFSLDIFSPDLVFEFLKYIGINNHAIKLINSQQLSYKLIYNLGLVELKTLKVYIEINLANKFIK